MDPSALSHPAGVNQYACGERELPNLQGIGDSRWCMPSTCSHDGISCTRRCDLIQFKSVQVIVFAARIWPHYTAECVKLRTDRKPKMGPFYETSLACTFRNGSPDRAR